MDQFSIAAVPWMGNPKQLLAICTLVVFLPDRQPLFPSIE
jgi:hypothetical protein